LEKNLAGMGSFILSEGFFFVMLIAAFVYYNVRLDNGALIAASLDRFKTVIFSIFLLSSSVTLWRAEVALKRNRHEAFHAWWAATILLGLVFIIGQGKEYATLINKGLVINSNLFATTFFTLTGFHGLHVCVGLAGLLIVLGLAFAGDFRTGRTEAVRTLGWYWHFVDVVWLFVFTTVYVIGPKL
jgi:heme/copper-type cytochrome/quinol oxidase subunit 3